MALHQLRETESQKEQKKFLHDIIENDPNINKNKEKLQVLHREHERITRLVKEREDGAREELSSEKHKEATSHGEVLTEDELISSEGEVQTVKRKDDANAKKSKMYYQFEQIIFIFECKFIFDKFIKNLIDIVSERFFRLLSFEITLVIVSNTR